MASLLAGPAGNIEFPLHARKGPGAATLTAIAIAEGRALVTGGSKSET
jgi:hypothetical protein